MKDRDELSSIYAKKILISEAEGDMAPATHPSEDGDQIARQASGMVGDVNVTTLSPVDDPELEDWEDLEDLADEGGINAIETFRDSDIPTYTYKSLTFYMHMAYEAQTKNPEDGGGLLIYGDPGLGKSALVNEFAKQVATSEGRTYQYINWHEETEEKKKEILSNPEGYFVLIDIRVAQMDPTDLQGLPDPFAKTPYTESRPQSWAYLLSRPGAAGVLFLDEINQGDPQTLKALFEVVNEHKVSGMKMAPDVAVFGAGNLGSEFGNDPIPPALSNRFAQGALIADPEGWLDYAEKAKVNARIIAFVKSNPSENFYMKPQNPDDPFPSPRQFVRLSKAMAALQRKYAKMKRSGQKPAVPLYKALGDQAASYCGATWGRKFLVFLEHMRMFDLKQLLANPQEFMQGKAPDELYALSAFISGKLKSALMRMQRNNQTEPDEDVMEIIEGVAKITLNVKDEFRAILWAMIASEIPEKQRALVLNMVIKGNYDPATKAAMGNAMVKVRGFMKGV